MKPSSAHSIFDVRCRVNTSLMPVVKGAGTNQTLTVYQTGKFGFGPISKCLQTTTWHLPKLTLFQTSPGF